MCRLSGIASGSRNRPGGQQGRLEVTDPVSDESLIEGLRTNDPESCRIFWERYGVSLEAIAARQLSGRLKRRVGPDDIVQSVFRTFFRRVSNGQFDLPDADSLWRLMCAITLTKARRAARDHHRKKRGLGQESSLATGDDGRAWDPADPVDSESLDIDLADEIETLLRKLGDEECQVLEMKMNHLDNDAIAERMGCSERTVRRLVKNIQDRWEKTIAQLQE